MKKILGLLLVGTLCLCIALSGGFALGEATAAPTATAAADEGSTSQTPQAGEVFEDPQALTGPADTAAPTDSDTTTHVAKAATTLKVRRAPELTASGNGSIAEGALVYILELGNEWCKVDTGRNTGYVQTKYLTDIREYGLSQGATPAPAQSDGSAQTALAPQPTTTYAASLFTPEGFKENFKAYMYKATTARKEMDERSSGAFKISKFEQVTISAYQGDWCYIRYKNSYGFIPTDSLFKWDRIDPYAGDIPGCIKHVGLAFVNRSTEIRSYQDNGKEVLKTVNPGAALAVDSLDAQNRYPLRYWRTEGYVDAENVGYILPVVPWEDAKSGDMISCMSTYYAVGIHTLQYQGRNYNIYLGTSFISGTVLHQGETVNIYDVMGPYRKSTGYHHAPIMSATALWGYGGGVCQVNTTLYNALIQVPIYINWRKVHADVGIYYCPVGFDAAVGGGDITMIFTNTLPYSVRINYFMSDGCLTVGIFRV